MFFGSQRLDKAGSILSAGWAKRPFPDVDMPVPGEGLHADALTVTDP